MGEKIDKTLILNRIKSYYNFRHKSQLARFLGIETNTISNWYTRNMINYELVLTKCEELNPNWIINGTGRPTKDYDNLEENSPSIIEEIGEYNVQQNDEIEQLRKVITAQEKTIVAQAKTIEVMERLIGKKE